MVRRLPQSPIGTIFYDRSRNIAMATNFVAKSAKLTFPTFVWRTAIPK